MDVVIEIMGTSQATGTPEGSEISGQKHPAKRTDKKTVRLQGWRHEFTKVVDLQDLCHNCTESRPIMVRLIETRRRYNIMKTLSASGCCLVETVAR